MSTPELNPTEALLDEQAWRAQYRAPNEALALGQALVATASTSAARSAGWWHQAFVLLRGGRLAEGRHALAQAWRAARQTAHRGGGVRWLARCRDAQSMVLRRSRKPRQALQLLQLNLALPLHARSERERYISHNLSALSAIALGELDDGLRHYMLALDAARQGGDVAMVANASANLCGLQSDLLNLEDAIPIAEEAVAAAESAGLAGQTVWFTALHNRAFTALAAGDAATAGDMASRMQQQAMSLPDGKRARYALLWAEADLVNGRSAEAEAWLAHSREHWREPDELLLEWSLVRARLDNQAGAFERARAVCDAARALTVSGGEEALPYDRMRLFEQGSRACEGLGDARAALAYAREAFAQYERVAGRAAQARRVSAQAALSLALERRSRDEEARRRQAAEAEQQRLAGLNQALEQANAAKSRFLAAASHDLRQPLHALSLQLGNLQHALEPGSDHAPAVQRIGRSVTALSAMFEALLDVSQIEAGHLKPRRAPVAIRPLLLRLAEEYQLQAEAAGLRMALRLPDQGRGLHLDTDPALLETLLRNLIGNALKYTRRGGAMLALRRSHARAGQWRLQVLDTGIGIPAEWQSRVFDDFVQVGNPERARAQGLGLGLSIVRRLATQLGHGLQLRSRPGIGTTVSLVLQAAPAEAIAPDPAGAAQPLAGLSLAVVEDDPDVLAALVERLQRWGAQVLAASDGAGLLSQLPPKPVLHALITDLRLPGGRDGLTVARRMRQRLQPLAPTQTPTPAEPAVQRPGLPQDGLPGPAPLPVLVVTAELPPRSARDPSVAWAGKPLPESDLLAWLQPLVPALVGDRRP